MARRRKKAQAATILIVLLLIVAIVAGACYYWFIYLGKTWADFEREILHIERIEPNNPDQPDKPDSPNNPDNPDQPPVVTEGELTIRFLELGNKYTGDCTLIKAGDVEVLIDAGSKRDSAKALVPTIREYCTDGVIEYVIATHAHEDHIAAFVGNATYPGIFDSFECKTIIDYARTNSTSKISRDYAEKRDAEVEAGAVHYTALECWNGENGAQRTYEIADGITFSILYNYYYEHRASSENDYSVCTLFTQGTYHYLFTGDLEAKGEEYLVQYNDLPQCKLYKGGHHGSRTSSTDTLLRVIRPEVVCICCCTGSPEYSQSQVGTFPTQDTIDRLSVYTDKIYATSLATNVDLKAQTWDYTSLNGTITCRSDGNYFVVEGSNHSTILKDTPWFQANRTWNGK